MDIDIRIERLQIREKQKLGNRIMPGGDMYTHHMEFIQWARKYDTGGVDMRSGTKHDEWQNLLLCKQIVLNGADDLEENFKKAQVEINYSYVEGVMAPDGDEIEAEALVHIKDNGKNNKRDKVNLL